MAGAEAVGEQGMTQSITIVVNGEPREVPAGSNVAELLRELGLVPERVAIERNLQILPRAQWQTTVAEAGDRFEIVQFVGGGRPSSGSHDVEIRDDHRIDQLRV